MVSYERSSSEQIELPPVVISRQLFHRLRPTTRSEEEGSRSFLRRIDVVFVLRTLPWSFGKKHSLVSVLPLKVVDIDIISHKYSYSYSIIKGQCSSCEINQNGPDNNINTRRLPTIALVTAAFTTFIVPKFAVLRYKHVRHTTRER
jgi:hypothetical protein